MSIYAYIRVSTEMQTHENQEYEIRKYCSRHGIEVTHWVTESVSGTVAVEKRELGKTISSMSKGDILISTELSRLGRNMLMIMGILNVCSSKGIAIHTIKDNFDLSDSINSKIIAFAFALAAEIERNLISQRTREALALRKINGIKLGRPKGSSHKKRMFYKKKDEIYHMIQQGKTLTEIALSIGIHRNTLSRYLKDEKISTIC